MPTMTTTPTTEAASRQVPKSMRAVEARLLSRLRRSMSAGPVDRSVRKAFALI
jgi:hypothetical protein